MGALLIGVYIFTVWPVVIFWAFPHSEYVCLALFALFGLGVVSAFRLARLSNDPVAAWVLFSLDALIMMDWLLGFFDGLLLTWMIRQVLGSAKTEERWRAYLNPLRLRRKRALIPASAV